MKKNNLLFLLAIILVFTLVLATGCGECTHSYQGAKYTVTTQATETSKGSATVSCTECGESITVEIPMLTDTTEWTVNITPATHETDGSKVYTSAKFGSVTITIAKGSHDYTGVNWTISQTPTLTATGTASRDCACGHTDTVVLPVLSDTSVWTKDTTHANVVVANCTTAGVDVYTSTYGTVTIATPVDATNHDWATDFTVDTAATCTTDGSKSKHCSRCDATTEVTVIPATGHTYSTEVANTAVAATCTTAGKHADTKCACGDVKTGETIAALGHDYTGAIWTITVEPTVDTTGTATRPCSRECGHSDTTTVAVLTDTTVWTKAHVAPDYNNAGSDVYVSAFGSVVVEIDRLVAPYDNKTYSNMNVNANNNGAYVVGQPSLWSWSSSTITLDGNMAIGKGFPFDVDSKLVFQVVNEQTGEIEIRIYKAIKEQLPSTDEGTGSWEEDDVQQGGEWIVVGYEDTYTTKTAYIDWNTGIFVMPAHGWADVMVLVPADSVAVSSFEASSWNGNIVITYTDAQSVAHTMYVIDGGVYFDVTLTTLDGTAVSANDAYVSQTLVIKQGETKLAAFALNDQNVLVGTDGFEGAYTNSELGNILVDGIGGVTLFFDSYQFDGNYVIDGDKITAVIDGLGFGGGAQCFDITIDTTARTYDVVPLYVTITFQNANTINPAIPAPSDAVLPTLGSANDPLSANVAYKLPIPTSETHVFDGWVDSEGNSVADPFATASDVTLYALWKAKVVVNVAGIKTENGVDGTDVLYLGAGSILADALDLFAYGTETDVKKIFAGWYSDADCTVEIDTNAEVSYDLHDGTTIYAKWVDFHPLYGTYYGNDIYGLESFSTNIACLTIDAVGNVTFNNNIAYQTLAFQGVITAYDPTTQKVTWKASASDAVENYFWYDSQTIIIAGLGSNTTMGSDAFLMVPANDPTQAVSTHYSLKDIATGAYTTKLATVNTPSGAVDVLLYNNYIYSNVSLSDALGNALAINAIADSKTLIIKDNAGQIVLELKSDNGTFAESNATLVLDNYGTFANGDDTISLDGVNTIIAGQNLGTYTQVTPGNFDVYMTEGDATVYYSLAVDFQNGTYTMTKEMVTITFVSAEEGTQPDAMSVNKNIQITLPQPLTTVENKVFLGWYVQGDDNQVVVSNTLLPVEDVTYVAKWVTEYVVTIHYNSDALTDETKSYGEGVVPSDIENPTKDGFVFGGWFTTADFQQGTEWTNDVALSDSVEIWAKWNNPPFYAATYTVFEMSGTEVNGRTLGKDHWSAIITIDANGNSSSTGSYKYPINSAFTVESFDESTNVLIIKNSSDKYIKFVADPTTGILVAWRSFQSSAEEANNFVPTNSSGDAYAAIIFVPMAQGTERENYTAVGSYWNRGHNKVVTISNGTQSVNIYIDKGDVHVGVTLVDINGQTVTAEQAYVADTICIKSGDTTVAMFGHDGTTLVKLDGYQGTYTYAGNDGFGSAVVNGVDSFVVTDGTTPIDATYTLAAEGSTYTLDVHTTDGTAYYQITLDTVAGTYTLVRPTSTIKFQTSHGTAPGDIVANHTIACTLPTVQADGYVFRGWYLNGDADQTLVETPYVVEIGADSTITLVAKWDELVTLTIDYAGVIPNVEVPYGIGDTVDLEGFVPARTNSQVFSHWSTIAGGTADVTLTNITTSTTIHCVWKNSVVMAGTYSGGNAYQNSNGTKEYNITSFTSKTVVIDDAGEITAGPKGTIADSDKTVTNGSFVVGGKFVYFNAELGLIIYEFGKTGTTLGTDMYLTVRNPGNISKVNTVLTNFGTDKKFVMWIVVTYTDNTTKTALLYEDVMYTNVSWGTNSTIAEAKGDHLIFIDGVPTYARKSNAIVLLDGYQATYVLAGNDDLVLDGAGGWTKGDLAGTYTVASENNLELYTTSKDAFYTVVVDKSAKTYTINQPMATVTLVSDVVANETFPATEDKNINVKYTLPSGLTSETHKFRYWYLQGDESQTKVTSFTLTENVTYVALWEQIVTITFDPGEGFGEDTLVSTYAVGDKVYMSNIAPEDPTSTTHKFRYWYLAGDESQTKVTSHTLTGATTFVAKWDQLVTITIVYGEGLENETISTYAIGDTMVLDSYKPEQTNGKVFKQWTILDGDTYVAYTPGTVTGDVTLYVEWQAPHAMMGTYKGGNIYSYSTGTSNGSWTSTMTIDAQGKITGTSVGSGNITLGADGKLTYGSNVGYYDANLGIVVLGYGGKSSLTNDTMLFVKVNDGDTITYTANKDSYVYAGLTKFHRLTITNGDTTRTLVFVVIVESGNSPNYANVYTFVNADDIPETMSSVATEGNVIELVDARGVALNLAYSNGAFVGLDGFQGTYTGELGDLVLNGAGVVGTDGSYSPVVDNTTTIVVGNKMNVITLGAGTYTVVEDAYKGTWTLPDGATTVELDGKGNVVGGGVYNVANDQLIVTVDGTTTAYGMPSEGTQLLGKSAFAGLTFTGNYYDNWDETTNSLKIVFDDGVAISGTIYANFGTSYYFNFTGVLSGNTLTLTITSSIESGAVGKTMVLTIEGDTMTVTSWYKTYGTYTFADQGSVSCEGFAL